MRTLFVIFAALIFSAQAWSQGNYWQATGDNGYYADPYTACYASHQSFSANAGITPNEYSPSYTNEGINHAISCKWNRGGPGYWGTSGNAYLRCPAGTVRTGDDNYCGFPSFPEGPCSGNPIDIQSGTKKQIEVDFSVGRGRLNFSRVYSSDVTTATALGRGWASNFHPFLQSAFEFYYGYFTFRLDDGQLLRFIRVGTSSPGVWKIAGISSNTSGWVATTNSSTGRKDLPGYSITEQSATSLTLRTPDGVQRDFVFPSTGSMAVRMTAIRYPDGYEITLNYNSSRQLESVEDTDGYSILFQYNSKGALEKAITPDGAEYRYAYEFCPTNNCNITSSAALGSTWRNRSVLKHVIYPDTTPLDATDNPKTEYHYEHPDNFALLTGKTDERGVRISTWDYDNSSGAWRAVSSEGPLGRELTTIEVVTSRTAYKVTNALGKETDFTFGLFGPSQGKSRKLVSVDGIPSSGCPASNVTLNYTTNGHLNSFVAEEGQTSTATVNATSGLPSVVNEGVGSPQLETTNITWDATIRKPLLIQRQGLQSEWDYDSGRNIIELQLTDTTTHTVPYSTNGETRTWTYSWYPAGLLQSIDGPLVGTADTISFSYDAKGNLASVTDELGHTTTVNLTDDMGRPTQVTEASGTQTVFTYTPRGWLKTITVNPGTNERVTELSYDAAGNLTRIESPGSRWNEFDYDASGWLYEARSSDGGKITYEYDLLGNVTEANFRTSADITRAEFIFGYDELGRLRSLLGGAGDNLALGYDRSNRLTKETDGLGREWLTAFDPLNRVLSVTDPELDVELMDWSPQGGLDGFTDGRSLTTAYVRNGFGEPIRETSPDRGITDYWYDAAGRVTRELTAGGRDTLYAFDAGDRLLAQTYPNQPDLDVSYGYDDETSGNFGKGRLTSISGGVSDRSYTYDIFGSLTEEIWILDAQTYAIGYEYAANGDLSQITYPSGRQVGFGYDSGGRIETVETRTNSAAVFAPVVSGLEYAPYGPLTGYTIGNGVTAALSLDTSYRLTQILLTGSSGAVLDKTYTYDDNSRVTGITDAVTPASSAGYSYHLDGRLKRATGIWGDVEWTYDAVGNRLLEEQFSGSAFLSSTTYVYPSGSNRILETVSDQSVTLRTFSHTPDGNISVAAQPGSSTSFTYSEASRIEEITPSAGGPIELAYDAFGRRVWRNMPLGEGIRHFVFLPDGRLLGEYEGATGAGVREYIWMGDRLVASADAAGTLTFIQTGPLGQPLIAMSGAGALTWKGELSPFGELVTSSTGPAPDARFLGQWEEAGSGLYQNWHRTYDASLGRYLEADPLGLAAGQSLYGYAEQDPVNSIDPEGLSAAAAGAAGGSRWRSGGLAGRAGAAGAAAAFWRAAYAAYTSPFRTLAAAMARDGFADALASPASGRFCPRPRSESRPVSLPIDGIFDDIPDDEPDRCRRVMRRCVSRCSDIFSETPELLPGSGKEYQPRLDRCIKECVENNGCGDYFG